MANRFKVSTGGPYPHFATITLVRWLPVFVSGDYFKIILDSLLYMREHRGLLIHAYVIMPTHIHAVLTALNDDLSDIMRDFKRFTSRSIYQQAQKDGNRLLVWMFDSSAKNDPRSSYKVWQDEFHPEVIYSPEFFNQKVNYLNDNPVRKALVDDAGRWLYSSAQEYATGKPGPLSVDWPDW